MKKLLLYLIFFTISLSSFAQRDTLLVQKDTSKISLKKFDKNHLATYKKDADFNYQTIKTGPTILERILFWLKRILEKWLSYIFDDITPAVGLLWQILSVIPYLIAGFVLFLIVKFFLKVNTNQLLSGAKNHAVINVSDDEKLMNSKNLPELISQAIADKNYRLATRYLYLQVLQKLTEKELISWQQDKTNEDYIQEITDKKIDTVFEKLTYFYDFVWYGNFEVHQKEFEKAHQQFQELKRNLD